MTSATGDRHPRAVRGSRADAFTLVEVMVVVAILALLMSIILVATVGQRKKSAIAATRALIQRIELALGTYYSKKGEYPPDGFDSEVRNDDGVPIRGSACLHYFLSRPLVVEIDKAGEIRTITEEPPMNFRTKEIQEDPENPGVFEVVDAFGIPMHYDNTQNSQFVPQDGSAHMPEVLDHPPDPRESTDYGVVPKEGIQRVGYDLWSHGGGLHRTKADELDEAMKETIASWNISASDI